MLTGFLAQSYFMGIVFLLLVLSILLQIIIGVLYRRMLRETDNMAATENRLLKQCKLKFTNCYELNEGTINLPVFVDKFLYQFRFAGISLAGMAHLSGQLMLLSVFAAGGGVCKGMIDGRGLGELLPYYIVSLFGLYIYFSVTSLVDARGKRSAVRTNLIDYLENHMAKRLQLAREKEMQPFIKKRQETEEKIAEADAEGRREASPGREQEELEELLREFLA